MARTVTARNTADPFASCMTGANIRLELKKATAAHYKSARGQIKRGTNTPFLNGVFENSRHSVNQTENPVALPELKTRATRRGVMMLSRVAVTRN
jgi:hypothetical protein